MFEAFLARIRGTTPPEKPPQIENPNRKLVIDTFNAVYERYQTAVRPILEKRNNGALPSAFTKEELALMNGFKMVRYVKGRVMGANVPLTPDRETYTYLATFYDKNSGRTYFVNEGIPVNPLLDFLNWEQRIAENNYSQKWGNGEDCLKFVRVIDRIKDGRVILLRNCGSWVDNHPKISTSSSRKIRVEAEAYIISQDPYRAQHDAERDYNAASNEILHYRKELVVPPRFK